jgi:small subunit ribosomal protein S1
MTERTLQDQTPDEMDFAALLDSYMFKEVSRGDLLEGTILEFNDSHILVDVGVKRDALVHRNDVDRLPPDVLDSLKAGKEVLVVVVRPRDREGNLIVSLSKALQQKDWTLARELMESEAVVEQKVTGSNRGGILVELESLRGFIPDSHITSVPRGLTADERDQHKYALVGKLLPLKVIDVDPKRNRLVLSERLARHDMNKERLDTLQVGEELTGRVTGLKNFGAFVDVGGVNGLVHISELDWSFLEHPAEILKVGQEIKVRVIDVDRERGRVALSRKACLPDPWPTLSASVQPGDLVIGKVASTTEYGIFVEVPSGLVGLTHLSEMQSFGGSRPEDLVNIGDLLLVRINEVDAERQRIELSLDKVPEAEQLAWIALQSNLPADLEDDQNLNALTDLLRQTLAGEAPTPAVPEVAEIEAEVEPVVEVEADVEVEAEAETTAEAEADPA